MVLENNNFLLFLFFFLILCVVHITIIVRTYIRYKHFSNGCYKNSGQDIIFLCNGTKEEVIRNLILKTPEDTLYYDFLIKDNHYYINVKGTKRFSRHTILTGLFEARFVYGKKGMYIVISYIKKWQIVYAGLYGAEMYEFITRKVGGIPVERVQ